MILDTIPELADRYDFEFTRNGDQFQMRRACLECGASIVTRRPASGVEVQQCHDQMLAEAAPWRALVRACRCNDPDVQLIRDLIAELDEPIPDLAALAAAASWPT